MDSSYSDYNSFKDGSKKVHDHKKGKNYVKKQENKDKKVDKTSVEAVEVGNRSIYGADEAEDESLSEKRAKTRKRNMQQAKSNL